MICLCRDAAAQPQHTGARTLTTGRHTPRTTTMKGHSGLHYLLFLVSVLLMPRLLAAPSHEPTRVLEELVLRRVGHIPSEGLYSCITRQGGEQPDLTLKYSAIYTHDPSSTKTICSGKLSPQVAEVDEATIYCLPPCPGVETSHLDTISVVVRAKDKHTKEVYATSLQESFTFIGVTPTVTQHGVGVVAAEWTGRPGRTYQVQLWHYPVTGSEGVMEGSEGKAAQGNGGWEVTGSGEMSVSRAMGEVSKEMTQNEVEMRDEEVVGKQLMSEMVESEGALIEESVDGGVEESGGALIEESVDGEVEESKGALIEESVDGEVEESGGAMIEESVDGEVEESGGAMIEESVDGEVEESGGAVIEESVDGEVEESGGAVIEECVDGEVEESGGALVEESVDEVNESEGKLTEESVEEVECMEGVTEESAEGEVDESVGVGEETGALAEERVDEVTMSEKMSDREGMMRKSGFVGTEYLTMVSDGEVMQNEKLVSSSKLSESVSGVRIRCYFDDEDDDEDDDDDDDDDDDEDDDDDDLDDNDQDDQYDDDDDDNDADHENDNDDLRKGKRRWWKCYVRQTKGAPSTPRPALLHTSGPVRCSGGLCQYYFVSLPALGSFSVEVMDVTDSFVHSSRVSPITVQDSGNLTIDTVVLATKPSTKTKTLTVALQEGTTRRLGIAAATDATQERQDDLEAVVINGHDHSEALSSLPEECDPVEGVCAVRALETLWDPMGGGPVSNIFLLLSSHILGTSSLVSVTDAQVRVNQVGPGSVQVAWDRTPNIPEFSVRVLPDDGQPSDPVAVACSKRGSDCQTTFSSLTNGQYTAEVSYEDDVTVVLTAQFVVGNTASQCSPPFTSMRGKCIYVEKETKGSWSDMKDFCAQLGGQMLIIDTDSIHYHVVRYLKEKHLTGHDYWIGGSDEHLEDDYRWLDGSKVRMGTPFWAYSGSTQEPDGGNNENCILLRETVFFFFIDANCNHKFSTICESYP